MDLEEGKQVMKKCIAELKKRFIINAPTFKVKIVDAKGCREIDLDS